MNSDGLDMRVIRESYGWVIDDDGEVHGLTAGDQHYEPTGIKIDGWHEFWCERAQLDAANALVREVAELPLPGFHAKCYEAHVKCKRHAELEKQS